MVNIEVDSLKLFTYFSDIESHLGATLKMATNNRKGLAHLINDDPDDLNGTNAWMSRLSCLLERTKEANQSLKSAIENL